MAYYYEDYVNHDRSTPRQRAEAFLSGISFVVWMYDFQRNQYVIFDARTGVEHRVSAELAHDTARFITDVSALLRRDAISSTERSQEWKEARIVQINVELDIIKGRVPTPKGYKVDTTIAKKLMQELKDLGSK